MIKLVSKEILKLFIMISSFFESILLKMKKGNHKHSYFLHKMVQSFYCLSMAFTLELILSIAVIILIAIRYNAVTLGQHVLFWIPIFLTVLLIWIVILNYKNLEFSLPNSLLSALLILKNTNFKMRLFESILSIFIIPIILTTLIIRLLSNYSVPTQEMPIIVEVVFTICFIISLLIYSESTKDEFKRLTRQFVIWFLIFLGFMILTLYQINTYIIEGQMQENMINISIAILGLVLTMVTIIDKARLLYGAIYEKRKDTIIKEIDKEVEKYSIDKFKKILISKYEKISDTFIIIRKDWNSGKKIKVIRIMFIAFLPMIFLAIIFKTEDRINNIMETIVLFLSSNWFRIFKDDKELGTKVLGLLIISGMLIKCIYDLIRNFNKYKVYNNMVYICRILGLLMFMFIILATIFSNIYATIFKYAVILIFVIILILLLLITIIEKIWQKRNKKNNRVNQEEV